ncbi:MAG: pyridoxal 5'-phosphate synthase glutaminase subunit PdxT [Prevotella sp.]|nr:pyridoxal 5'-phosphate synthase glutaminase subunit PdxT [Prevotella sp.]
MRIAVLALQGAFLEHEKMLGRLGVDFFEVRQKADWDVAKDGLIIPGGESTTQGKLLNDLQLMPLVRDSIQKGLPVFGTCAGLILLAKHIQGTSKAAKALYNIGTMDITAQRNAYGRQLGSFATKAPFQGIDRTVKMVFIRAPYITDVDKNVQVLARVDGNIVAARQGNQLVTAFHPELTDDTSVHEYFLKEIVASTL